MASIFRLRQRFLVLLVVFIACPAIAAEPVPAGPTPASTLPELIQKLQSPDAKVRAAAELDLGDKGEQAASAVGALRARLKDSDPLVRAEAAWALGHIGKAAMPAVEDLVRELTDPDANVRRAAIGAVRLIHPGPHRVVPLMLLALKDKEPSVVLSALQTISDFGEKAVPAMIIALRDERTAYWACLVLDDIGPAASKAVPQLTKTLADSRPEVRMEAAMALGEIGVASASAVPELTALLADKESGVRYAAVYALGSIGPQAVSATPALERGLEGDDLFLKTISAGALARLHDHGDAYSESLRKRMVPVLFEALKSKQRRVRLAAARSLHELKLGPEVLVPAFARLVSNSDGPTVSNVLDAVASLGEAAVPGLTKGLQHKEIRLHVAEILGRIGEAAAPAVPALIEAMQDERPEVRRELLFALGNIGPKAKAAVDVARKSLEDPDEKVRYSAVWALGRIGPDSAVALPDLQKNVCGKDPYFGNVCAWALVRIDPTNEARAKEALPVLIKGLGNEKSFVRGEAARTLSLLGPKAKEALPALKALSHDKDPDVAQAAADAIKKISQ